MATFRKISNIKFESISSIDVNLVKRYTYHVLDILNHLNILENTKDNKSHELSFIDQLTAIGFTELETISDLDIYREDVDILGNIHFMPHLSDKLIVVHEPFGSQNTPDFILIVYGFVIYIEFKSSKSNKIMWNSTYSQMDWIYVYSNSTKNTTLLFTGSCIISEAEIELAEEFKVEYRQLSDKFKNRFLALGSKWGPYPRVMLDNNDVILPEFEKEVYTLINERITHAKFTDYSLYAKYSTYHS